MIGFNKKPILLFLIFSSCLNSVSCSTQKTNSLQDNNSINKTSSEEEKLNQFGNNWFYGQGIGKTTLNISTAVVFPPYLIYLVGNAGLSLAGYEPISLSNALPEKGKDFVDKIYDETTSVPGRITSGVAGVDYKN